MGERFAAHCRARRADEFGPANAEDDLRLPQSAELTVHRSQARRKIQFARLREAVSTIGCESVEGQTSQL